MTRLTRIAAAVAPYLLSAALAIPAAFFIHHQATRRGERAVDLAIRVENLEARVRSQAEVLEGLRAAIRVLYAARPRP